MAGGGGGGKKGLRDHQEHNPLSPAWLWSRQPDVLRNQADENRVNLATDEHVGKPAKPVSIRLRLSVCLSL